MDHVPECAEGAIEQDPGEVESGIRSDGQGTATEAEALADSGHGDLEFRSSSAKEKGADRTDRAADAGSGQEGVTGGQDVDAHTGCGAADGAGGDQLAFIEPERAPGVFAEEVGVEYGSVGGIGTDAAVSEEFDDSGVGFGFAGGDGLDEAFLELFPIEIMAGPARAGRSRDLAVGERVSEQFDDDFGAIVEPLLPFVSVDFDGLQEFGFPGLFDAGEGFEQFDAVLERGVMGVEFAHGIEVKAQSAFPLLNVVVGAGAVDQCEARLAGEAEDFHLGGVDIEHGFGSIDDIEETGAVDEGLEEETFGFEGGVVSVAFNEITEDGQRFGVVGSGGEFGEGFAGVLKSGGIVEGEQFAEFEALALDGFPGHRADAHLIVFGECGNDGRFAVVDGADDGEGGGRVDHELAAGVSRSRVRGRRWMAWRFLQCWKVASGTGPKESSGPVGRPTRSRMTSRRGPAASVIRRSVSAIALMGER